MAFYILRRLVWILPTVLLVLVITFVLTRMPPGDPIYQLYSSQDSPDSDLTLSENQYNMGMKELGLDRPLFYVEIVPFHHPDTLYKVPLRERGLVHLLLRDYRNWDAIESFRRTLKRYMTEVRSQSPERFSTIARLVYGKPITKDLDLAIQTLVTDSPDSPILQSYGDLQNSRLGLIRFLPTIKWRGSNNQFHNWLNNLFRLDFGISRIDARPVATKVGEALSWTLFINIISILLAYLISIPLGMYMGWYHRSRWLTAVRIFLYAIYAVPIFWLATLLVVFFTTSEYGSWTNIFQSVGIWQATTGDSFAGLLAQNAGQFVIPILCLTLSITAYVSRQVESSVNEEKTKRYILQTKAKGLGDHSIIWKHLFRNSSFPLITLISGILPASISGSLVLEVICNIPGMGRLLVDAIFGQDWSVVILVVFISSFLTIIGLLLSDILYRIADPRLQTEV